MLNNALSSVRIISDQHAAVGERSSSLPENAARLIVSSGATPLTADNLARHTASFNAVAAPGTYSHESSAHQTATGAPNVYTGNELATELTSGQRKSKAAYAALELPPGSTRDPGQELYKRSKIEASNGNQKQSMQLMEEAATLDHAESQYQLGYIHHEGIGWAKKDRAKGIEYTRLAALQGHQGANRNYNEFMALAAKKESNPVKRLLRFNT